MEIPNPRAESLQPKPSRGSSGLAEELDPNQESAEFSQRVGLGQKGQMGQEKSLGMQGEQRESVGFNLEISGREFSFCSYSSQGK